MIDIALNGEVLLNGTATGYGVAQEANATRVFRFGGPAEIRMPQPRYAPTSSTPGRGIADRTAFERDFRSVTGLRY